MRELLLFLEDFNMLHAGFYTGPLIFILRYLSLEISSLSNQNIHSNIKQETEDCVTKIIIYSSGQRCRYIIYRLNSERR